MMVRYVLCAVLCCVVCCVLCVVCCAWCVVCCVCTRNFIRQAKSNVHEAMGQLQEFEELLNCLVDVGKIDGTSTLDKASKRFLDPVSKKRRSTGGAPRKVLHGEGGGSTQGLPFCYFLIVHPINAILHIRHIMFHL